MRLLAAALVLAALLLGACGKHVYTQEDLSQTMSKHLIDLRWGRIVKAASYVDPDMQMKFVEAWQSYARLADVQDLEVVGVTVDETGDNADVTVALSWVDRSTMRVKNGVVQQKWKRTENGWRASDVYELPGSGGGERGFGGG